jgi:hypothetical protein
MEEEEEDGNDYTENYFDNGEAYESDGGADDMDGPTY